MQHIFWFKDVSIRKKKQGKNKCFGEDPPLQVNQEDHLPHIYSASMSIFQPGSMSLLHFIVYCFTSFLRALSIPQNLSFWTFSDRSLFRQVT
jgi:hypothetical protein